MMALLRILGGAGAAFLLSACQMLPRVSAGKRYTTLLASPRNEFSRRHFSAPLYALIFSVCVPAFASAQGAIQQSGPATPGQVPAFVMNGVVASSGQASGGDTGQGVGEFLAQSRGVGSPPYASSGSGPLGTNICFNDGPVTHSSPYHYLCFSANAAGGGLIDYGAGNGAPQLPFQIIVNGQPWTPGGSSSSALRVITSGTTATAVNTDGTIAWKSADAGTKTTNLYACNLAVQGYQVTVADDLGTASPSQPILLHPAGSDTIGVFYTNFPINFAPGSTTLQCDGSGNWVIR